MAARRGDFERPLGMGLAPDVGEVLVEAPRLPVELPHRKRLGGGYLLLAGQIGERLAERLHADDLNPLDDGRLGHVGTGQHDARQPLGTRPERQRQDAPHRHHRTVERQLAREHRPLQPLGRDALHGRKNSHGDGQVEAGTLLAQVGRSEVDHHLAAREALARVLEGGADALLALLDGVVGQPHQVEAQPAPGDVDLDGHRHGVDSHDCSRIGPDKHSASFFRGSAYQKGASSPSDVEALISNSPPPGAAPRPPPGTPPTGAFEPLA